MRVGVDATSWVNRRGYGRFARNSVRALVERDRDTTYLMYIDAMTAEHADLPSGAETRRVELRRAPSEAASASSNRSIGDLLRMAVAARRDRPDVFLFRPPTLSRHRHADRHRDSRRHPSELPDLAVPGARARFFSLVKGRVALGRETRLFTVSEASRRAISSVLKISEERLTIVPEAPDPVFRPVSSASVSAARAAVGLRQDERFLLYAGGISPHKNLETLIAAHARLPAPRPRLVAVGDLERETYVSAAAAVRTQITALGLEEDVLLPGFVRRDTGGLYTSAGAVVIPSWLKDSGCRRSKRRPVERLFCSATSRRTASTGGAAVFFRRAKPSNWPPRSASCSKMKSSARTWRGDVVRPWRTSPGTHPPRSFAIFFAARRGYRDADSGASAELLHDHDLLSAVPLRRRGDVPLSADQCSGAAGTPRDSRPLRRLISAADLGKPSRRVSAPSKRHRSRAA